MNDHRTPAEREALEILVEAATRGSIDLRTLADAASEVAVRAARLGESATREALLQGAVSDEQLARMRALAEGITTVVGPPSQVLSPAAYTMPLGRDPTDESPRVGARYAIVDEIGRGGVGLVVSARDAEIGRTVAMKTLRTGTNADKREVRRFLDEARIAGQLEHPSIVPVYDLGALPDGQPFYTMRVVERRTLRAVLVGLAENDDRTRHEWPLARLCHVLVQVSRALDYAHKRTIVHRDVKPENILLGRFGEVYVADWGIAKRAGEIVERGSVPPPELHSGTLAPTHAGSLMGTVGYMSPEQVLGGTIDGRADLFSLGVVLYEVLTHGRERPFDAASPFAALMATTERTPPRPRELAPDCPLVLDELCMRLLAKLPDERPESGQVVADEIESYLEGDKERARREQAARELVGRARAHAARYVEMFADRERFLAESRTLLRDRKPHDPIDSKRAGWAAEDRARGVAIEQADALAHAQHCYSQAMGLAPHAAEVRAGLADLYWMRAERAVQEHDVAAQTYHEALVREYDALEGRYTARLTADSCLSLRSHPSGAEVVAYRYVERDRVLVAEEPVSLGATPIVEHRLPPGSFLLVLKREGMRDTRLPVSCRRGEHASLDVNLYTDAEIGDAYVYVPGGPCFVGGDADAFDALPRREVTVPDFALARFPVTYGEYLAFIDDVHARDPAEAKKRIPRDESGDGAYAVLDDASGRWIPRYDRLIEGEGRRFSPEERAGDLPVMAIDWFDANAYLAWRSAREGRVLRLPTELEFEKAARGVDARPFPWGERFDPTFCKMRESRPGFPQPELVGAFPLDESPYGVRDVAGGMREWVADVSADGVESELSLEAALATVEPAPGTPRDEAGMRLVRGGAWCDAAINTRAASRVRYFTLFRYTRIGLRVRAALPPR